VRTDQSHIKKSHPAKAYHARATGAFFRARNCSLKGLKLSHFIVEDVPLDVGQNNLLVTATDWVGNARSQRLTVSRVNVGSNRITLAGGNRQRGALNTELTKPLIVTAIDRAGLPLANIPLTFEVLRGTGSINPATTSSTTNTTGSGTAGGTVTTTIPNALTGSNQPATQPNGVNAARRLLITTDANGRAAVWFTLGRQSGEAGNMVQVSASDTNSKNATLSDPLNEAITEAVVFTATGERGVPAKVLAEGGGAQYAETGGQPLDPLTTVTYDGEINPVPNAVIAYVIEQDGGVDLDDGAKFNSSSAANATAISANGKVLITSADNNGRSAARPTMGFAPGTVRISTYAMPPNTALSAALLTGLQDGSALSASAPTAITGLVGLATFQIAVLQQSDGPTQFTGKILDHTGKPLQGVRITISRTPLSVTTDASGNFTFLQDVPPGKLDLFVDGRAVTGTTPLPNTPGSTTNPTNSNSSPTQYPSLHFEVLAIRGQKNILSHPMYLPPLLMSQAKIVGGSEDVSITIPGFEGFEMIVKANSVTFPDGSRVGPLVVSPVHADRLPMVPPGGSATFMSPAWTIQPSGTRFDPPIEVRIANSQNLKPGQVSEIYQWDHDLATFVPMGRATVSDDGSQLITDAGSGVTKAGWGGNPNPPPCTNTIVARPCTSCEKQESVGSAGGNCPATKVCFPDEAKSGKKCDDDACKKCEGSTCKEKFSKTVARPEISRATFPPTALDGWPAGCTGPGAACAMAKEGDGTASYDIEIEPYCDASGSWKFKLSKLVHRMTWAIDTDKALGTGPISQSIIDRMSCSELALQTASILSNVNYLTGGYPGPYQYYNYFDFQAVEAHEFVHIRRMQEKIQENAISALQSEIAKFSLPIFLFPDLATARAAGNQRVADKASTERAAYHDAVVVAQNLEAAHPNPEEYQVAMRERMKLWLDAIEDRRQEKKCK
jgi:large repetitive protein